MRQTRDAECDAERTRGPESPSSGQLLTGQLTRLLSLAELEQRPGGAGAGVQEAVVAHLQPPGLGAVEGADLLEVGQGVGRTSLRQPQSSAGGNREHHGEV